MSPQESWSEFAEGSVVSAENPWPGLESFREADQRWFQGRRAETVELLQHVKRERLMVMFALSGIGKSSLLQAGLFPALRRDAIFPVYIRLDYAADQPDLRGQVLEAITHAGFATGVKTPGPRQGETLWEYFHRVDAEFWDRNQRRVLPLLVFDQFEEIFTLGRTSGRTQSENFLDEIADLAEGTAPATVTARWATNPAARDDYLEEGEYKLLISLREDFLAELYDQRHRIAAVPHRRYRLLQMNGEGALLAVGQAKDLVDEAVAAQIVRYVAASERLGGGRARPMADLEVEPALLSVVCRELNNRRRELSERKISADLLTESQERVLSDFYTRSLVGMPPAVRKFVEDQLITVGGARNPVALDNALAAGMTDDLIEKLVERRLLRKEPLKTGVRVELTHDLLTGVVRASRELRQKEEAAEKQRLELEEAAEKQRREREEAKRKLRRSGILAAAFAGIAVLAVGAAGVALQQRATAATKTALAIQAQKVAEQKTQEANRNAQEADRQKANVLAALSEKDRQTVLAQVAARQEKEQATIATQRAAEALASRADALKSAAAEKEAGQKAIAATKQAGENQKKAEIESQNALKSQQAEAEARKSEEVARRDDQKKAEQLRKGDAQKLVNDAPALISTGQEDSIRRALGNIARSLSIEPSSMAAKSLAFDQLLRGNWRAPVDPSQSGSRQFVHLPLTHPARVLFAVFSPDGRVATAANDNKIRMWDWQAGSATEIGVKVTTPTELGFSPDGHHVGIASYDLAVPIWDILGRNQALTLSGHKALTKSVAFSRDGKWIVTSSQDTTVRIWDAATGKPSGSPLQHPKSVNSASFSPDGSRIVTACADGKARVWSWPSGAEVLAVSHAKSVNSATFSSTGNLIVTASSDGTARVWDAQGQPVGAELKHDGAVYYASFSPTNDRIVTASDDGRARIWDAQTGNPVTAPLVHTGKRIFSASFSRDGRRIVTACDDCQAAQVWEVWYDFESVPDLISLLEYVSGYDVAKDGPLSQADTARIRTELQTKANQQPATSFLRWFFAHRQ